MTTVFTVGHGTRTTAELVAILRAAGVRLLCDVRRFPGSRRNPHFGREALASALPAQGLAYAFRGDELGGRRSRVRGAPTRHPAWREEAFQGYADYMDTPPFRAGLAALEADARSTPTAVMCAETLWWRCHRRLIADALAAHGFEVVHLVSETNRQLHPAHPSMRVDEEGRPVYDVGVTGELLGPDPPR